MQQYELQDGNYFSLLSLCKSPLQSIRQDLAESMNLIFSAEERLDSMVPDWRAFAGGDGSPKPNELCESFGLSQELIDKAKPPASTLERIQLASMDPSSLMKLHEELLKDQAALRSSYMEEAASIGQEDEQAAKRKHDNSPHIYNSMKALAETGVLKGIVQEIRKDTSAK